MKALDSAATAMEAQQTNLNRISNDLANVNTSGFKRSKTEFQDLYYETLKEPGAKLGENLQTPVGIQVGMGTKVQSVHKVFDQGAPKITNQPFDLMINGDGFFPVQNADGSLGYVRTGTFFPNEEGVLMTSDGARLLPEIALPKGAREFVVTPSGDAQAIMSDGKREELGELQVVTFANPEGLIAKAGGVYQQSVASGDALPSAPGQGSAGTVQQGALEGSNVNVPQTMVEMIQTQKAYEMGAKVINVADRMLESVVNLR